MARPHKAGRPEDLEKQAQDAIRLLQLAFPDGAATGDVVRQQGFHWSVEQWRKRWPSGLTQSIQLDESAPGRPFVTRQDVLDRARDVTSETDAIELFLLMAAWGTGTQARPISRVAKVLHQDQVAARLLSSYRAVRDGEPAEAYRRLRFWSEDRIKYFGPAFFTKWLYFSAFEAWDASRGPAPLILDARVAASLAWPSSSWSSARYGDYLELATLIRDRWAPGEELHVVEYALFKMAGRVAGSPDS